jgi:hypothetical protein
MWTFIFISLISALQITALNSCVNFQKKVGLHDIKLDVSEVAESQFLTPHNNISRAVFLKV